jgi:hypothetical protein
MTFPCRIINRQLLYRLWASILIGTSVTFVVPIVVFAVSHRQLSTQRSCRDPISGLWWGETRFALHREVFVERQYTDLPNLSLYFGGGARTWTYASDPLKVAPIPVWCRPVCALNNIKDDQTYDESTEIGFGWPLPVLSYQIALDRISLQTRTFDRVVLAHDPGRDWTKDVFIPGRVNLIGAMYGVSVWSGMSFVTICMATACRREMLKRKNRCIRCGYSLVGIATSAVCPECGRPR